MSIDYNLTCDTCGIIIDGSMVSADEVRRVAKREGTAFRFGGKDLCKRCYAEAAFKSRNENTKLDTKR